MKETITFENGHIFGGNSKVINDVTAITPHSAYGFLELVLKSGVKLQYNLKNVLSFQTEG